jgi:transcriptional regulator with XRE-family HTH domain
MMFHGEYVVSIRCFKNLVVPLFVFSMNTVMEHRLAEVRERKGVKQAELARRVHLSRGQIANLEAGNRTMDLPTLRRFAVELGVPVVELLLPSDAPEYPDEAERAALAELRAASDYDSRSILAAVKGVIAAARSSREALAVPKSLEGNAVTAAALARTWNAMDDEEQQRVLHLVETAREFRR